MSPPQFKNNRKSSDLQTVQLLSYCPINWTQYSWIIFLVNYVFACRWIKHWHAVLRKYFWDWITANTKQTHSLQCNKTEIKNNNNNILLLGSLTYAAQHSVHEQSIQSLFLHEDPTACHVKSTSSWQWVMPVDRLQKKSCNFIPTKLKCSIINSFFFLPSFSIFLIQKAFDSDTRAHISNAAARYFFTQESKNNILV